MNTGRALATAWLASVAALLPAQHWTAAGIPGNQALIRAVATNAAGDTIYYGGVIPLNGDFSNWWLTNSVMRYADGQWDTLGVIPGDVKTLLVHRDTLFAGGDFEEASGNPCAGIAFHDGEAWQPYGDLAARVYRLRTINGELYAVGAFQAADGGPAPGIAKRVGGQWVGIGQIASPSFAPVVDIASYNGELVMTSVASVNGIRGIHHLVGNDWVPLGPGIQGGLSGAGRLAVYQGDLYVTGQFSPDQGNAGKEIMRWDGASFHPLGSGLQFVLGSNSSTCSGLAMLVHDGLLWVGSGCRYAGGVPAMRMATWNGNEWCGVPGNLASSVKEVAFYRDTLFVGLIGDTADGMYVNGAAKFIGDSYVGECGLWAGVQERPTPTFTLYPNPTNGLLQVEAQGMRPRTWRLTDALGREVLHGRPPTTGPFVVDLGTLGSGLYHLVVEDAQGMRHARAVYRAP